MERAELISLLAGDSPVDTACRAALEQGASFRIWEGDGVPADNLAATYRLREVHPRERRIPTLGFAPAVETPRALDARPVRLGQVR